MCTYFDYYERIYSTKLKRIDLFLKTSEQETFNIANISNLLEITETELSEIAKNFNIETIDKNTFFIIMNNGSSEICKLFSREVERKLPHFYTFEDISYIYDIPYEKVASAAYKAKLKTLTSENLSVLFKYITM